MATGLLSVGMVTMALYGKRARESGALVFSAVAHGLLFWVLTHYWAPALQAAPVTPTIELQILATPAAPQRPVAADTAPVEQRHETARPKAARCKAIKPRRVVMPRRVAAASTAGQIPMPVVPAMHARSRIPDRLPSCNNQPLPHYPVVARRRGLEGVVLLRVAVAADGTPQQVVVQRSSGHAVLDVSACATVRNWRFLPALRDGQAVPAEVQVPIRFRLSDAAH